MAYTISKLQYKYTHHVSLAQTRLLSPTMRKKLPCLCIWMSKSYEKFSISTHIVVKDKRRGIYKLRFCLGSLIWKIAAERALESNFHMIWLYIHDSILLLNLVLFYSHSLHTAHANMPQTQWMPLERNTFRIMKNPL